jgi:hypothetical protein
MMYVAFHELVYTFFDPISIRMYCVFETRGIEVWKKDLEGNSASNQLQFILRREL